MKSKPCDTCGGGVPVNSGDLFVDGGRHHLCGHCRKLKFDRIAEIADKSTDIIVNFREVERVEGIKP